jgi:hypothetical protein
MPHVVWRDALGIAPRFQELCHLGTPDSTERFDNCSRRVSQFVFLMYELNHSSKGKNTLRGAAPRASRCPVYLQARALSRIAAMLRLKFIPPIFRRSSCRKTGSRRALNQLGRVSFSPSSSESVFHFGRKNGEQVRASSRFISTAKMNPCFSYPALNRKDDFDSSPRKVKAIHCPGPRRAGLTIPLDIQLHLERIKPLASRNLANASPEFKEMQFSRFAALLWPVCQ